MTSKVNLNLTMGAFYPQRSNISFSHSSAFQTMQKSYEMGGPARQCARPWVSPENRCRAGNTYSHLLPIKKMLDRPVVYE